MEEKMFTLLKDGVEILTGPEIECLRWIHTFTPFSWHYALLYGGYKMVNVGTSGQVPTVDGEETEI
jgi:hypothetical protein